MKKTIAILCLLLPLLTTAQKDSIVSGVYNWKEPAEKSVSGASIVLFEGQAHDMEWLQVSSNTIQFSNKPKWYNREIPANKEEIIIVKSGTMDITVEDSSYALGSGGIMLLMPGQKFSIRNFKTAPCSYYTLQYRNKQPANAERGKAAGGSIAESWDTVTFKPSDKGGRRDFLNRPTTMSRRVEIHASTLKPGFKSHDPHTHIAPEMVIVTEGQTEMQIGTQFYKGSAGSVYFLASTVLHAIQNKGSGNCTYFAIQLE